MLSLVNFNEVDIFGELSDSLAALPYSTSGDSYIEIKIEDSGSGLTVKGGSHAE